MDRHLSKVTALISEWFKLALTDSLLSFISGWARIQNGAVCMPYKFCYSKMKKKTYALPSYHLIWICCLFFTHKYNDFVTELELAGNRLGQDGVRSVCDLLLENPVIRKVVGTVVVGRTISN